MQIWGFQAVTNSMAPVFACRVRNRPVHYAANMTGNAMFWRSGSGRKFRAINRRADMAIMREQTSMRFIQARKGFYGCPANFSGLASHVSLSGLDVDDVEHMRLPQLHECHALRCKKIKRSIISEHEKTGNHVKTATFHIPPVIEDRGKCRA